MSDKTPPIADSIEAVGSTAAERPDGAAGDNGVWKDCELGRTAGIRSGVATDVASWRASRGRRFDRGARWGSVGSVAVHGVALLGLAVGQPLVEWFWGPAVAPRRSLQIVAQGPWRGPVADDPLLDYAIELERKRDRAAPKPLVPAESAERPQAPPKARERQAQEPPGNTNKPDDALFAADAIVRRRVDRAIEEAGEVDTEENLKRLDRLSGQLEKVATDASVAELNDKLKRWLGTKPRATEPAKEPISGPFEIATAQVHDVRREGDDTASYRYIAVLLDAAGRQMDQELGAEDGEKLYRTFQLIKKNPLLEKVYRQVVMGLLDKLTRPMP